MNDPGWSHLLFLSGDHSETGSPLQITVSILCQAAAIHKLRNKSISRVNELKMHVFKIDQGKWLAVCGLFHYCKDRQRDRVSEKYLL